MKIKDITCNSPIEAEGFRSALLEAGIQSNIFDETNSKVARGIHDKKTDVFVREEDYEQAMKVYESYMASLLMFIPIGVCTTEKFVCNSYGHKWER